MARALYYFVGRSQGFRNDSNVAVYAYVSGTDTLWLVPPGGTVAWTGFHSNGCTNLGSLN